MSDEAHLITDCLRRLSKGDQSAESPLADAVYNRLRHLGRVAMSHQKNGATLQPTALVNEVLLELLRIRDVNWKDRGHFYRVASRLLRRRLIDHIRSRRASKRAPSGGLAELDEAMAPKECRFDEIIWVHEGLSKLAELDAPLAELIEMVYFGGVGIAEAAKIRGVATRTIIRHLEFGRLMLTNLLASPCPLEAESSAITVDRP